MATNVDISAFAASFSAGISVGIFSYFLLKKYFDAKAEQNEFVGARPKIRLPLLFRLTYPFHFLARTIDMKQHFPNWVERDNVRLGMAGFRETLSVENFQSIRIVLIAEAVGIGILGAFSAHAMPCILFALLLGCYPDLWLKAVIKKRHLAIMKALPNVLDLLTLSVESGRDLISALRDILSRRKRDELSEELSAAFQEIQLGRKRSEALRALADRVRQQDLTATINAIVQAEELGVSIAQLLRIQGDMQRNKRFSLAEKMANESAVKIILPVVIFILPAVFLILLGPLAYQAVRNFGGR